MNFKDYLRLVNNKKFTIFLVFVFVFLLVIVFTAIQPFKYGAQSKILVVQNQPIGSDSYAISRSNELLSGLLADVISSDSFYKEVLNSGFNIDKSYFSDKSFQKEIKNWRKTVKAKPYSNLGLINVQVYHKDKVQISQIAQAINYVLINNHKEYHGGGNSVIVKVIDGPVISDWPVKPNILSNLIFGFLFSILISFLYIYLFPVTDTDKTNFKHEENKIEATEKIHDVIEQDKEKHKELLNSLISHEEESNNLEETEPKIQEEKPEVYDRNINDLLEVNKTHDYNNESSEKEGIELKENKSEAVENKDDEYFQNQKNINNILGN